MTLVKRGQVPSPIQPEQAVDFPEIGGEVIISKLRAAERFAIAIEFGAPEDGESESDRLTRLMRSNYKLLSLSVLDGDRMPLWTADEWSIFSAVEPDAFDRMAKLARNANGWNREEAEKN